MIASCQIYDLAVTMTVKNKRIFSILTLFCYVWVFLWMIKPASRWKGVLKISVLCLAAARHKTDIFNTPFQREAGLIIHKKTHT